MSVFVNILMGVGLVERVVAVEEVGAFDGSD